MIYIPRHIKTPVDAYQYSIAMRKTEICHNHLVRVIRNAVIRVIGVNPLDITYRRKHEFVEARQLFAYFVKRETKLSLREIGDLIGKDHATVIASLRCVEKFIQTEKLYKEKFEAIDKIIKEKIK
jgi:chromosomal replication initiation ATPase DnaA